MSVSGEALRALIDDCERMEMTMREHMPEIGHIRMDRHVDVLIFEDSDTDAYVIEQILRQHRVKKVARVEDANDWERWVGHYRPRVILMDVIMPGKNGFAAMREIVRHPRFGKIPVVMCSSKQTECDLVWALKRGAAGYVGKPIQDPANLMTTVRDAVRKARHGQRIDLVL